MIYRVLVYVNRNGIKVAHVLAKKLRGTENTVRTVDRIDAHTRENKKCFSHLKYFILYYYSIIAVVLNEGGLLVEDG